MKMRFLLLLAALATGIPLVAQADPPVRKVTVIGTAIIHVVPDEMHWTIQVSINDSTLPKAKARHDESLAAALSYLKGLGSAISELQTGGIRFDKNMYPGDDSFLKIHPFSCSTQVTFTLTDFDKYGSIADALSKLDGAQVLGVAYATSKEAETRRDALKRALLDAHEKAGDLATTAGCFIDKPLEILEQEGFTPQPAMFNAMVARSNSGGTPDAVAGQIDISARVQATYDLYYK